MNPPDRPPNSQKSPKPAKPLEVVRISQPSATPQVTAPPDPQHTPIPPPTELLQYRAIGLIKARYQPHPDNICRGELIAEDGTVIDALVLGRLVSIVKKRLDISQSHFWVVYPRTHTKTGKLHVQMAGVWAPQAMGKTDQPDDPGFPDGYFSVRGEVVQQSAGDHTVVVKIRRLVQPKPSQVQEDGSAKKRKKKRPYNRFKLKLVGALPSQGVGCFWDINVQRQGSNLCIMDGKVIAPLKKPSPKPLRKVSPRKGKKPPARPTLRPRPPQR
jgi:hypothetical protein